MSKFVVVFYGDVESAPYTREEYDSLEEAVTEVKKADKYYTPGGSFWEIYEVINVTVIESTPKRY